MTLLNHEPYNPTDWEDLPLCVVFDIDGTLARHVDRGPFDFHKLMTDTVHENIKSILKLYWNAHYTVFLVSGRSELIDDGTDVRALTEQWLDKHDIPYDHLFMRPFKDFRNDADLKHEIFDREFRGQYDIENWFDDRDRVVARIRSLSVPVLQVAEGNF